MPRCRVCEQVLASAELRRVPRGFRCKDAAECERRRERAAAQLGLFHEGAAGAAVNAASAEAYAVVLDYAAGFHLREDYRPLEELAEKVQRAAVRAGVERLKELR